MSERGPCPRPTIPSAPVKLPVWSWPHPNPKLGTLALPNVTVSVAKLPIVLDPSPYPYTYWHPAAGQPVSSRSWNERRTEHELVY